MKSLLLLLVLAAACGDNGDHDNGRVDGSIDAIAGAACTGTNASCGDEKFCDFARNTCGVTSEAGACTDRPALCPQLVAEPTCGCDGKVYVTVCDALASGVDLDSGGRCALAAGDFVCGYRQCDLTKEYCEKSVSDVATQADKYACKPLPICTGSPTCACLAAVKCGATCGGQGATGLTVTCQD